MLFLKILEITGIVLLILLGIILLVFLTVLFSPISYRADAARSGNDLRADIRVHWIWGLIRGRFTYPQPGVFTLKLLWLQLFPAPDKNVSQKGKKNKKKSNNTKESKNTKDPEDNESGSGKAQLTEAEETETSSKTSHSSKDNFTTQDHKSFRDRWDCLQEYKEILLCEDSRELMHHIFFRLSKILKSIRPRQLRVNLIYGTGSPDTTGYLYGLYGILLCQLGRNVYVTPDFEQRRLDGSFYAKGHTILFLLLLHGISIALDKRLKQLIQKLKRVNNTSK